MAKRRQQQNRGFLIFIVAGGLLLLGAAVLLFLSGQQDPAQPTAGNSPQEDPIAAFPRVTLEETKALYDSGEAVILDVRTEQEYQQAHIPGAVLIPYAELPERLSELDPAATYVTYCT